MTTEVIKTDIHRLIDSIEDKQFLNALYTILEKHAITTADFWPTLSPDDQAAIRTGIADANAGRVRPMAAVMQKYQ
jgi:hypothetical protein